VPTTYLLDPKPKGSILFGIITSILSLIIIGANPLLGTLGILASGVFGGMAARGKGRGFLAAFIGGIIVSLSLIELAYYYPSYILNIVPTYIGNLTFYNQIMNVINETSSSLQISYLGTVIKIVVGGALISGVGGLIGGTILPNENTLES
jgi:hypothetical protein